MLESHVMYKKKQRATIIPSLTRSLEMMSERNSHTEKDKTEQTENCLTVCRKRSGDKHLRAYYIHVGDTEQITLGVEEKEQHMSSGTK